MFRCFDKETISSGILKVILSYYSVSFILARGKLVLLFLLSSCKTHVTRGYHLQACTSVAPSTIMLLCSHLSLLSLEVFHYSRPKRCVHTSPNSRSLLLVPLIPSILLFSFDGFRDLICGVFPFIPDLFYMTEYHLSVHSCCSLCQLSFLFKAE